MAKYTEHYRLHQWKPEDNSPCTDFNEDSARIDSAIAAWGNCPQAAGIHTEDDSYGKGKVTVLHFSFWPLVIMVVGGSYQATSFSLRPGIKGAANDTAGIGSVLSLARGEDSLFWYVTGWTSGGSTSGGTSAEGQLNEKGVHYTYLVLG